MFFLFFFGLSFVRVGFDEEATFAMSMKGRFKLVHNGYEYTKGRNSSTSSTTSTWRCVRNRWKGCKGKAVTRQIGQKHMVKCYEEHDHDP